MCTSAACPHTATRPHSGPRPANVNANAVPASGRLLNVAEAAERLGTGERFVRRLISERRIAFVKVGRHVRLAESVLDAYVLANTVPPVTVRRRGRASYRRAA
ncbi:putative excisionase [Actinacidiphila reveromycinica]|uniref:Putative excisionase n=1 Tax=Actinacidiphila reveromycinica TaxID=659352 RepID=A0A7U3VPU5_9ACTN|nr:putative excisionase [Streptomyces sp. SN-593]